MAASCYEVLYTRHKTRKHKVWQDGVLKATPSRHKFCLIDSEGKEIDHVFLSKNISISLGTTLESDRHLISVEGFIVPKLIDSHPVPSDSCLSFSNPQKETVPYPSTGYPPIDQSQEHSLSNIRKRSVQELMAILQSHTSNTETDNKKQRTDDLDHWGHGQLSDRHRDSLVIDNSIATVAKQSLINMVASNIVTRPPVNGESRWTHFTESPPTSQATPWSLITSSQTHSFPGSISTSCSDDTFVEAWQPLEKEACLSEKEACLPIRKEACLPFGKEACCLNIGASQIETVSSYQMDELELKQNQFHSKSSLNSSSSSSASQPQRTLKPRIAFAKDWSSIDEPYSNTTDSRCVNSISLSSAQCATAERSGLGVLSLDEDGRLSQARLNACFVTGKESITESDSVLASGLAKKDVSLSSLSRKGIIRDLVKQPSLPPNVIIMRKEKGKNTFNSLKGHKYDTGSDWDCSGEYPSENTSFEFDQRDITLSQTGNISRSHDQLMMSTITEDKVADARFHGNKPRPLTSSPNDICVHSAAAAAVSRVKPEVCSQNTENNKKWINNRSHITEDNATVSISSFSLPCSLLISTATDATPSLSHAATPLSPFECPAFSSPRQPTLSQSAESGDFEDRCCKSSLHVSPWQLHVHVNACKQAGDCSRKLKTVYHARDDIDLNNCSESLTTADECFPVSPRQQDHHSFDGQASLHQTLSSLGIAKDETASTGCCEEYTACHNNLTVSEQNTRSECASVTDESPLQKSFSSNSLSSTLTVSCDTLPIVTGSTLDNIEGSDKDKSYRFVVSDPRINDIDCIRKNPDDFKLGIWDI